MSHTNSTPNYSLPQFLSSDKPAWMADINAAMSAIDTGMKANADAATAAQSTADKAVLNGAPGYSNLSTYDVDDVVNYQGRVYKCVIAVTTPEVFDNAKWILYDLQDASKAIDDIDLEIGSGDISEIGDGSVKGAILEMYGNLTVSTISVVDGTDRGLQINNVKKIGNVCYVNLAFAPGTTPYTAGITLATLQNITANGRAYLTGYLTNGTDFAIRQLMISDGDNKITLAELALLSGYTLIVQGSFVTN